MNKLAYVILFTWLASLSLSVQSQTFDSVPEAESTHVPESNKSSTLLAPLALPPGDGGVGGGTQSPSLFTPTELYQLSLDGFAVLDKGLFGDQHELYTGELWFKQTDLEIKTNLGIPISVTRSAGTNKDGKYNVFGNWNLDIPSLYGPIMGNFMTGANVCSTAWTTSRYIPGSSNAEMMDNGPHLGGVNASRVLLLHDGSISAPANTLYVSEDNWAVTCANNIYKAISPQGITYTFGQLVQFNMNSNRNKPSTVLTSDGHRGSVMLMVTNITDRFGKTINFTYQDGLISKISSSDGSEVNFAYNANYDIL